MPCESPRSHFELNTVLSPSCKTARQLSSATCMACNHSSPSLYCFADHRYLSEDLPFGLVPMKGVADLLGVPETPWFDRVITWGQELIGKVSRLSGCCTARGCPWQEDAPLDSTGVQLAVQYQINTTPCSSVFMVVRPGKSVTMAVP